MESTTTGDANMAVPIGNTTAIDPRKSGNGPPGAGGAGPPVPEYKPVSELYVKTMPDIDSEACGKSVTYPAEAEQLNIEGEVILRVELDEKGHVHGLKVLKGLGHGLDEAAMQALKHKCRFSPAIATDGKPVPYVIQSYKFTFQIER
jgi:protein TonB